MTADPTLIEVRGLRKHFAISKGLLRRTAGWVKAVDGLSFTIPAAQTLALVGESGCGKTTTAKLLLQLEDPTAGEIVWRGRHLQALTHTERRAYRRSVQAVFQDPMSSLNPRMRVGEIIAEPLLVNRMASNSEARERVASLLKEVGLRPEHMTLYPHEFSGGQRQRISIARALAMRPDLIVLDEPVSALDVSIRAQIMNLLKDLQEQYGISYLLIAHDISTVRYMAHTVAVMYLGKIIEVGTGAGICSSPLHPYTQGLLAAAPRVRPGQPYSGIIMGEVPSPINPPSGCHFHPRCHMALDACVHQSPILNETAGPQGVACHLYDGKGNTETDAIRKEVAIQREQQQGDMLDQFIDSLDFNN
jgi:oligopeptide/dipeptide ABC transporter ATP-binding protein